MPLTWIIGGHRCDCHQIAASIGAVTILGILAWALPLPFAIPCALGAFGALYFAVASLLASYWVYDLSPYYGMRWLHRLEIPETGATRF